MAQGQNGEEVKSMIDLGDGEKGYAALSAGWKGSERNGVRPLRLYCTA